VVNRNAQDGDALGHGKEDVATGLDSHGGSIYRSASACAKARKAAEGGFKGGGVARPVHSTAPHRFQDVISQCERGWGNPCCGQNLCGGHGANAVRADLPEFRSL
jgi:hypothetical protein